MTMLRFRQIAAERWDIEDGPHTWKVLDAIEADAIELGNRASAAVVLDAINPVYNLRTFTFGRPDFTDNMARTLGDLW